MTGRFLLGALASSLALAACSDEPQYLTREELLDPATCESCHPVHYEEWQSSMHAYAADDPVFLAMNARGQRETDGELGDFCVQCHAPMAVREGLTTDGLNLPEIEQKYKGVTCYFCHSVDAVEGTHNNPLRLAEDLVMRGGLTDPVENGAHRMAYSPLQDRGRLESSDLCGACHDIVTPAGVHLERTFVEWQESVFATGFALTCGNCHMDGRENEVVADFEGVGLRTRHAHDFPGVDVALTDWPGKDLQLEGIQRELDTSVQAQLCYNPDGNKIELTLTNVGAGHMWPSGSAQDRRAWVELVAQSGEETILETGVVAEDEPVAQTTTTDPLLWQLRDFTYDTAGQVVHMFWDAASYDSELLPPGVTTDMSDPAFNHSVLRTYELGASPAPTYMRVALHIRPIGLDVLDDLIATGDLEAIYRERMPTFTVSGATLEWTPEAAGSSGCVP